MFHFLPNGPPSVFLTLSTVYSFASLVGLFHPTATFGILLQGFSPLPSCPVFQRRIPSCRWKHSPAPELPQQRQIALPRLQGIAPSSDPLPLTEVLPSVSARSPLAFSDSLRLFSTNLGNALTLPPLMTSFRPRYESANRLVFNVSIDLWPVALSLDQLSCSSLPTYDLRNLSAASREV